MQKFFKMLAVFLFTLSAASISSAANPTYNMERANHLTSVVNVYNQSAYTYTVNGTYMGQYGATRKFVMALNAFPQGGSAIQFPVALPEYAIYLQIIRNVDRYVTFSGYLSSDDVYIRSNLASKTPSVTVSHQ